MQVLAQPFWTPKRGNTPTEYEDAFWPRKLIERRTCCFRCAVADGAAETSYSGIWAKQLVRYFCKNSAPAPFDEERFCRLQQRWSEVVRRRPLPWYAEEKVRLGASAAIVGLVLTDDPNGHGTHGSWKAVAVGDSCLFHMRGEQVLVQFPLADSAAFTKRPQLLSSNPAHNDRLVDCLHNKAGTWRSGDTFYLMTDALASWFMRATEEGRTPWRALRDLNTSDKVKPFHDWVETLRTEGAIRNDDVTLLRIHIA
jgi:hypothetical protein